MSALLPIFRIVTMLSIFFFSYSAYGQNLTISTTGDVGPTSGTNWSITSNTLNVAASGSANIHPDVISNHLNSVGNLTVVLPWQISVIRQCSIDGTITYTGSATRTLTFLIANDIFITTPNQSITATGTGALNVVLRAANSGGVSPDNGRISIRQNNTINTNGGHLWIGGGSVDVTWNGLTVGNHFARTWEDNVPGLWIENSTLNTNGGNVYLAGLSHNSSANSGVNYGVRMVDSDISSVSGNIEINGELKGRYQIGNGTRIESTTTTATSITTTTGSITISGKGYDNDPNDNGYRFGAVISGSSSTAKTIISTTSGNIQIEGNAYFTATVNDKEGLGIGGATEIISRSGNITIRGTNTLETSGHYCNSIRFDPRNESNSIRVGFDGTNSYTGNILIEGNSIYQRYLHSSAGSIAVQTTGTLTIQPTGTAFTYMRADNAGTLTYDDDWNFGTTLTGFTFGKSTNTLGITYNRPLTVAGPITLYGGTLTLTGNITSSNGSAISLYGNSLSIAGVLSSTGNLLIAGQTTSTPIGVAGGPGNLLIPSSYFATNFSNSLSGITIGSDNQTGAITAGTFTLTAPMTLKSTALTIAGPITLGNFDLTIDSRIAAVGGITSTTYFRTNGIGKIKRTINQNGSFRFPVGVTLTVNNMPLPVYLPITLTNKDVSREYYVSVSNGVYTDGGAAGTTSGTLVSNPDPRIDMTWNIGNSIGSVSAPGVDIVVNWPTAASAIFAGTSSLTTPTLLHHNGTQWGSIAGTTTYTLSTGTLTHTGYVGSFSPFAIAQSSGALPVTWLAFTGSRNGEAVDLNWSTGSEINTRDFEIQHSLNTLDWTVLGTIAAAGNSQTTRSYRYTHGNPLKGNAYNYYRIKQRDLDGQFSFSKIVSLLFGQPGPEIQVYPNPAFNMINVYIAEAQTIRLVNMAGATVWQGWMNAGRNTIAVDHLSKGIYTLTTNKGPLRILIQ